MPACTWLVTSPALALAVKTKSIASPAASSISIEPYFGLWAVQPLAGMIEMLPSRVTAPPVWPPCGCGAGAVVAGAGAVSAPVRHCTPSRVRAPR
jgi:hypothetical protein